MYFKFIFKDGAIFVVNELGSGWTAFSSRHGWDFLSSSSQVLEPTATLWQRATGGFLFPPGLKLSGLEYFMFSVDYEIESSCISNPIYFFKAVHLINCKEASQPTPLSVPLLASLQANTETFNISTLLVLAKNCYRDQIKQDERTRHVT